MATKHSFLAFDLGATSMRCILGTLEADNLTMREVHRWSVEALFLSGRYFWNAYSFYEHVLEGLSIVGKEGIKLEGIGIDGWGVDCALISEEGLLISLPRTYRDPYTEGVPEKFFKSVSRSKLYDITGIQTLPFNSIFQLYAQKKSGYAPIKAAKKIISIPDLLAYMLTGRIVGEWTLATTTALINRKTRKFDKYLVEKTGLSLSQFPEIVQPGTVIGPLSDYIAELTGVGSVPVIAVATHDTASAFASVPALDEKFAVLSSGTWSLMGIETPSPIVSPESCEQNFSNEGGIESTNIFLKNITGMWLLEQCRKSWAVWGRTYTYEQIVDMIESEDCFTSSVDPNDERFANPADMTIAIESYLLETGQGLPRNDAQMARCICNSLVRKYDEVLSALRTFAPFPIERLHIIDGGSANSPICQLSADVLGIPVVAGPVEATSTGNILVQARAAGLLDSRWDMRRVVERSFPPRTFYPGKKK